MLTNTPDPYDLVGDFSVIVKTDGSFVALDRSVMLLMVCRFGHDTGAGYNRQFRYEERDERGVVRGRYGYYDQGRLRIVNYAADPRTGDCRFVTKIYKLLSTSILFPL